MTELRVKRMALVLALQGCFAAAQAQVTEEPVDIGSRLELMVDRHLIRNMEGVRLKLHAPQKMPLSANPLPSSAYTTVIKDGATYRAYYRAVIPGYKGPMHDGHPGEVSCYAESADGIEWRKPNLGLFEMNGSFSNNVILYTVPFCHNFSPFLDRRPENARGKRFKALAGVQPSKHFTAEGLHAFESEDGIRWSRMQDGPVITATDAAAFDSQNVAFWSEAEACYVCYFRTWTPPPGRLRSISRATSRDFLNWSAPVAADPNLPGEHLYTSQSHPYFRAPHIYVALPTRYTAGRVAGQKTHAMLGSTDILFMTSRAGTTVFDRLFPEAFIRPGLDPARWSNRSNYAALNVVPTGPAEMSIYHAVSGHRYVLRTDGFVSVHADSSCGSFTTRALVFSGSGKESPVYLLLNASTSAAGHIRCELRTADGKAVPGFSLNECVTLYGDGLELPVAWKGGSDVNRLAGQPVTLHVELAEADVFAFRFGQPERQVR